MTRSERLRSLSDWEAATRHPFIRRILDGTLARSAFADYLIQDYLFVQVLVPVAAHLLSGAPSWSARRRFRTFLLDLLSDEDRYFQESFAALGIPAASWNPPRPKPVTERFCQFLLVEGASDPYGPRLATLLAGEWVYRDWASAAVPPPDPVYRRWVDLHATARFQGFVDWMRNELDALALSGTEEALVESRFIQVVAFEAQFWSEAPR